MIKRLFGFVIVLLVPTLFVGALFLGQQEKQEPPKAIEKTEVRSYAPPVPEAQPNITKKVDLTLPTEIDKTEAQQVAVAFVTAFHVVDPENPFSYLIESEPYMTERLLLQYEGIPKRGTLGVEEIRVADAEALPAELNDTMQVWTVEVTSLENPDTENEASVYEEYQVLMYKQNGEWRVDGVKMNER